MTEIDEIFVLSSIDDIQIYIMKLIDETNVGYQNRQDPSDELAPKK